MDDDELIAALAAGDDTETGRMTATTVLAHRRGGLVLAGRPGMFGGARLRAVAAGLLAVGTAAAVAGAVLASTSTFVGGNVANVMEIPALHDAASDRPIPYTPVCESGRPYTSSPTTTCCRAPGRIRPSSGRSSSRTLSTPS
jgi:hypothetical protein